MSAATLEQSQAAEALRKSPLPALRKLTVEETEQELILRGTVSSYYHKQMAQETVLPVLEGRTFSNQVDVVRA